MACAVVGLDGLDFAFAAAVAIFALNVLFVIFDANRGNEFVSFVYLMAKTLVLGLGDIFTSGDALLGVILDYGLAASSTSSSDNSSSRRSGAADQVGPGLSARCGPL